MKNIVIGSGPAGRLASMQLGKLGEEVTLIEKNHIAGTCLNEGCMVICALTDITKFIDTNKRFNNHGFLKSQIEISYEKIVEKITKTQETLRKIEQMENESVGNKVIFGEASIDGNEIKVNNESFEYDNLLIATGARPFIPDIKGSEYGLTNKDILKLDDVPETDYSTLYNAIDFVAHSSDADFISHVGDYFDMPVLIDYYIFLFVLNAFDNRGKNMYWAVYDKTQDKKLTIAVWDLDGSAGQRWIDQWIPDSSSPDYPFADNINLYYRLRQLNADAFNEKVLARYQQLRATCLSTDSLVKRYQDYDELLKNTGAAQREEERWSGDSDVRGEEISFQKETAYITDWITRHMQYLDDNVFTTTTNISYPSVSRHHTGFYNLNGQRINTPQKGIYIWKGKKVKR